MAQPVEVAGVSLSLFQFFSLTFVEAVVPLWFAPIQQQLDIMQGQLQQLDIIQGQLAGIQQHLIRSDTRHAIVSLL